jgi:hypothetical protein
VSEYAFPVIMSAAAAGIFQAQYQILPQHPDYADKPIQLLIMRVLIVLLIIIFGATAVAMFILITALRPADYLASIVA